MSRKVNRPLLLDAETVRQFHHIVLLPGQLDGESDNRTVEAVLARVEHQIYYGEIRDDVIEVAADDITDGELWQTIFEHLRDADPIELE